MALSVEHLLCFLRFAPTLARSTFSDLEILVASHMTFAGAPLSDLSIVARNLLVRGLDCCLALFVPIAQGTEL
jgi:hypothetical protein